MFWYTKRYINWYIRGGRRVTDKHLICRNGWYSYRKKVPLCVSHLDTRKEVKISLKTKHHTEALIRAKIYEEQIQTYWKALIQSGDTGNSAEKYKATVALAKTLGFAYKSTDQIAASTLNEIVDRLSINLNKKTTIEAALGGIDEPLILLNQCEALYWNLVKDKLANKNEFQIRKWKNPRKLAIKNFIDVIGDMHINDLTRGHILKFREWWFDRISEGLDADGGNKQQRHVRDILKAVAA